jgi:hypothetical protein
MEPEQTASAAVAPGEQPAPGLIGALVSLTVNDDPFWVTVTLFVSPAIAS